MSTCTPTSPPTCLRAIMKVGEGVAAWCCWLLVACGCIIQKDDEATNPAGAASTSWLHKGQSQVDQKFKVTRHQDGLTSW